MRGEIVFLFMPKVNSHLRIGCCNDRTYVGDNLAKDSPSNVATLFNPMSISPNLPLFTHTITLGNLNKILVVTKQALSMVSCDVSTESDTNIEYATSTCTTSGRQVLLLLFGHHSQLLGTLTCPHCLLPIDNMQTSCLFFLPHYSRVEEKS